MNLSKTTIETGFLTAALFGGLALSFCIPNFAVSGGDNAYNLIFCGLCAFAFLYLTIRNADDTHTVKFPYTAVWCIGLFSLVMIVTDFTGWYMHASLIGSFKWLLASALFFGTAVWVFHSPDVARKFAGCFVVGAALLSLYGFYTFTRDLGYLHLASIFEEHNAFGGFLLIPLCVSFALAFTSESSRLRFLYACTTILIGAGLILTFSSDTWAALSIGLLLGGVFFRKSLLQVCRTTLIRASILVFLILLLSGGWYMFAQKLGTIESSNVSMYGRNMTPAESTLDRFEYLGEASHIFETHPFGIGLGNYSLGAEVYRTSILHFSFDPHNLYVKMFVETGCIGGILFAFTLLYLFFRPAYVTYKESRAGSSSGIMLALLIGCGAALVHAGIEADVEYPLVLFSLFISLGLIWGLSSELLSNQVSTTYSPVQSISLPKVAAGIAGIVTLLFLIEFASTFYSLKASDDVSQKQFRAALSLYQTSALYDPTNAETYLSEGQAYYYLAAGVAGSQHQVYLNDALNAFAHGIALNSRNSLAYMDEAIVYQAVGNQQGAISVLEKAAAIDPFNDLNDQVNLVQLYLLTHQNEKAILVVNKLTTVFPPSLFSNPLWNDSSKEQWREDLVQLTAMEAAAYSVEGNTTGSTVAAELANQYEALKI